jgi:D-glucosaminate-specific PTS system IIC component
VITYFGASYATPIIEKMPDWILHGLSVSGGLLPAIGFATCVLMVGKKNLLPYFIIGFFLVKVISMPIITTAMFAGAAAFLHLQFTHKMEEGQLRKVEENA